METSIAYLTWSSWLRLGPGFVVSIPVLTWPAVPGWGKWPTKSELASGQETLVPGPKSILADEVLPTLLKSGGDDGFVGKMEFFKAVFSDICMGIEAPEHANCLEQGMTLGVCAYWFDQAQVNKR